jgi:hypothetical protein
MGTTGSVQSIRLVGLLPQKDYIQVQAHIRGILTLVGQPPANMLKK